MILFIMLYKVVLTFESLDQIFTSALTIQMKVLMPYITVVDLKIVLHVSCTRDPTYLLIGHFRVPKNLTFKTRLSAKPLL